MSIVIPLLRKAISRSRRDRMSKSNSVTSKICLSGRKVIRVPRLRLRPIRLNSLLGTPRSYSWEKYLPSWNTSQRSHSDRALTTDTPTPCRPPETL